MIIKLMHFFYACWAVSITLVLVITLMYPSLAEFDQTALALLCMSMFPLGVGLGVVLAVPKEQKEIVK